MSTTDRTTAPTANRTTAPATAPATTYVEQPRRRETRQFAKTSEFWAMLLGVVIVAAIYNRAADASLDLWRATLLGAAIAMSYIVSRGIAKAGSTHHDGSDL